MATRQSLGKSASLGIQELLARGAWPLPGAPNHGTQFVVTVLVITGAAAERASKEPHTGHGDTQAWPIFRDRFS